MSQLRLYYYLILTYEGTLLVARLDVSRPFPDWGAKILAEIVLVEFLASTIFVNLTTLVVF